MSTQVSEPGIDISELEEILSSTKKDTGYQIVLWNDDFNSFEWVIKCLMNYCKHDMAQAEQCSLIVHNNGKCQVKVGSKDTLIPIKEALQDAHLTVTLEKNTSPQ